MTFHIVTIFPKIFDSYFSEGIVRRAQEKKLIDIEIYNLRDYTTNKHKTVDDTPYGGGAGMVLKIEPVYKCIEKIKSEIRKTPPLIPPLIKGGRMRGGKKSSRIVLFSAKGRKYDQGQAKRLKKYTDIILICGRYEGVDERVAKYIADEEISMGEYILTGGEIPAMVVVDSITRLIPGVLGNVESPEGESFSKKNYLEYPHYTKPAEFRGWKVPEVLMSGDHKNIEDWRKKNSKFKDQNAK